MEIPEPHFRAVQDFLNLDDASLEKLAQAIEASSPSISSTELSKGVSAKSGLPVELVNRITSLFVSLAFHRNYAQEEFKSTEEYVAQVKAACLRRKEIFSRGESEKNSPEAQWNRVEGIFQKIFSGATIEITAKASDVISAHAHPVGLTRTVSDIRAIFSSKNKLEPIAAVIVHNLAIEDAHGKEYFFALDSSDLKRLKVAVDRATLKELALREKIERSGMMYIAVGE